MHLTSEKIQQIIDQDPNVTELDVQHLEQCTECQKNRDEFIQINNLLVESRANVSTQRINIIDSTVSEMNEVEENKVKEEKRMKRNFVFVIVTICLTLPFFLMLSSGQPLFERVVQVKISIIILLILSVIMVTHYVDFKRLKKKTDLV